MEIVQAKMFKEAIQHSDSPLSHSLENFVSLNSGDLVLDSFLGSGTTAAVAHKMKRRWIGIELGDHRPHPLPTSS